MDNTLNKFMALVERYALLLLLVLAFLLYKKFFGKSLEAQKEEEAATAQAADSHESALSGQPKKVPATASKTQKKKVLTENVKVLSLKLEATVAEEIRKWTDNTRIALPWSRTSGLMAVAAQMKKFYCSYAGTAKQYKAFTKGRSMAEDVRYTLGDDYPKWLALASSTP